MRFRFFSPRHLLLSAFFALLPLLAPGSASAKNSFGVAVDAFCAPATPYADLNDGMLGECTMCHNSTFPTNLPDGGNVDSTAGNEWDNGNLAFFCGAAANTAPTLAAIGAKMTTEGQRLTFNVTATDPDAGDTLTLSAAPLPNGATFNDNGDGTGTFDWTPQAGQANVYNVTFTVADNAATPGTAMETVAITVFNANQSPVLAAIGNQTVNEGAALTVNVSATDADADALALGASNLPTGATFNDAGNGTGSLNWTPGFAQAGNFSVSVTATDNGSPMLSDSETFMITVGDVNRPPVLGAIGDQVVNEGETLDLMLSASDPDGDGLTISASSAPASSTFQDNGDGTASFSWTPAFGSTGNYAVSFSVVDNGSPPANDSESINIAVGDVDRAPVLTPIGNRTVDENVQLAFNVTATDPDGDAIALSLAGLPTGATWTDNGDGTGAFAWTPAFDQAGNHALSFTATDNGNPVQATTENLTITVGDVNRPPVLTPIGNQTADEGVLLQLALQATDPDANGLTLALAGAPQGMALQDNGDGTGTLAWTPGFGDAGNHTVTVSVTDDGTPVAMDQEAVMITVGDVNRPPVVAPVGNKAGSTNQQLSFTVTASDPDGDALTLSAVGVPNGATFTDNGDGTASFDWTPAAGDAGSYQATCTASDAALSTSEVITIAIGLVNNPPTLTPIGDRTVMPGQTLAFTVMAADPDGNTLALAATGLPNGATLTDNGDGTASFSWTPAANQTGATNATFSVTDDGVPPMSDQEVVNLAIQGMGGAFAITEAAWWDTWGGHVVVHGVGAPAGGDVEVLDADSGNVLTALTANQGGAFRTGECKRVRDRRRRGRKKTVLACLTPAQAPCSVQVRSGAMLSVRTPVMNPPAQCGPASPTLLTANGSLHVIRKGRRLRRILSVSGQNAAVGETLEIRNAVTDTILGTALADGRGRFEWRMKNASACQVRVVGQAATSATDDVRLRRGRGIGMRKMRRLLRRWKRRCADPGDLPTPAAFGAAN
ncbi:MAG: tandem-95 repeat protein [bacterium]|nr:tandem-95 repeat protein [bacterium]